MATKKSEPLPIAAIEDEAKPELSLQSKIAAALDGKDDYVYVEVRHQGQTYAAWRSRNGDMHFENRGA